MKIDLKWSNRQKGLELITIAVLCNMIGYLIVQWTNIPDVVPSHYNGLGVADAWQGKESILFLPLMSVGLYLLITLCGRHPSIWNIPVVVNEENKEKVYSRMLDMVILLKLEIILGFTYITVRTARAEMLGVWFMVVFLLTIFGTLFISIAKVQKDAKYEQAAMNRE